MNQSLPETAPQTLNYTRIEPPRNSTFSSLSLCFAALFVIALAAAIVLHPAVGLPIGLTILLSPVAALTLGLAGRTRSQIRGVRDPVAKWGIRIGFLELGLVAIGFFLMGSMCRPSPQSNRIKCASNLRQIGQALQIYANDHHGEFPPDFDTLIRTEDLTAAVFNCPESNDQPAIIPPTGPTTQPVFAPGNCSYVYLKPAKKVDAIGVDDVLAYESLTNHHGTGINVLYGDGHVDWLPKADAIKLLAHPTTQPAKP